MQKNDPIKGDFYDQVMQDLKSLDLNITENAIIQMKKEKFKRIVKKKVRESALCYLKQLQHNHSKVRTIRYFKLELSQYMESPIFSSDNAKLLLALRTRTVNGIRTDFGNMFTTQLCPLCGEHLDTLPNLLTCELLRTQQRTREVSRNSVSYSDVYSSDVFRQKEITELYTELLRTRGELINSTPVAITEPVHSFARTNYIITK